MADFNTGATVFKDEVYLSKVKDGTFKIKAAEGERTFQMWDFVTMIGPYVEFDVLDLNLKIRCVFEYSSAARIAFSYLKPDPKIEVFTVDIITAANTLNVYLKIIFQTCFRTD